MTTVTLTCSVSVDGFATGPGGDLSRLHRWLFDFEANHALDFEDENMAEFRAAGALVIGRSTFRSGEEPWGEHDVFAAPVFVLTHTEREPLRRNGTTFTFVTGGPAEALALARNAAGGRDVVIMGSPDVARQFLAAGLVDRILLHLVPVLLGGGTRLFGELPGPLELVCDRMLADDEAAQLAFAVVHHA
ncbi:dihydrofolate reductase family protein [Microbacterium sp. DT81.1]|uniref:dihydrofolate reductase family protein n=1 Tax=Microbacterium sp. DT81.1 TaxID=3393413 RepID=UPI003CF892DC